MKNLDVSMLRESLAPFCTKWGVRELSLFGSILRDDYGPNSDVDVLVSFEPNARIGLWDMSDMVDDLELIFGRSVDLVEKEALRNPFRRDLILNSRAIIYAA